MADSDRDRAERILRGLTWLNGRGADLVEPILRHARLERMQAGQWVHGEGDEATGVLVVVEGAVQMFCQAPGGRQVLIGQMGPGLAIGQSLRFGGGPRLLTVVAAVDSLVLQLSDRGLSLIAASHPQIWEAVSALLYLQLRGLLRVMAEMSALPPRQRLAARLDQLATGGEAGGPIRLRLNQQALAEMVSLTRKTVNAYLADFEGLGLVRRDYGAVTLLDLAGLRALAAGED